MNNEITITITGARCTGKSTIAHAIAKLLHEYEVTCKIADEESAEALKESLEGVKDTLYKIACSDVYVTIRTLTPRKSSDLVGA